MGQTNDILVATSLAMSHVFLISAVGFCLSLFPRSNPLLPAPLLKQLSRLSISIFGPALIFYSTSSALDWVLFKKAIILCLFSVSQNLLCLVIGRMFRCFHPDRRFGKVIEIAVGTPNQLSLPIMVMLSMCKSDVINADFAGPELDAAEECGRTALAFLFVYAMGFYISFWGFGYGILSGLKKEDPEAPSPMLKVDKVAEYVSPPPVSNKFSNLLYVITIAKKALLNHMMLAVYAGILASVIPGLQDLLYSNTGYLRPLGDSMATIAEPLVCLNCFIMSGSLALTFSAKRAAPQSKDASMDIEIRDLDTSMPVLPRAPTPSFDEAEPIAKKPPFRSIFIHSALRLFVMPAIIIFIENALAATGALDKDERLIRLIIAVEATAPSAQMMIVSLNQLGIQDMAGALAYAYIPHYIMSIFTITGWTTLSGYLIYGNVQ